MVLNRAAYARLIVIVLLAGIAHGIIAQDMTGTPDAWPVVFYGEGGTVLLDEATGQVTVFEDCNPPWNMYGSPDGQYLAYRDANRDFVICEIATGETHVVQSGGAADDSVSNPAWSPDSSAFAWQVANEREHGLYVHTLDTAETRRIRGDLPIPDREPVALWGRSGILATSSSDNPAEHFGHLYTPQGELLDDTLGGFEAPTLFYFVSDADGTEYLVRVSAYGLFAVIPGSDDTYIPEQFEAYSLLAPDGLSVAVLNDPEIDGTPVYLPSGEMLVIHDLSPDVSGFASRFQHGPITVGIAPDGLAFALNDGPRFVWREGELTRPLPDIATDQPPGVIWGPVGYRFRGELEQSLG